MSLLHYLAIHFQSCRSVLIKSVVNYILKLIVIIPWGCYKHLVVLLLLLLLLLLLFMSYLLNCVTC